MHILSKGFSQCRSKSTTRPRDLQIRKVSMSDSSLSSGSDASTIRYTPTPGTPGSVSRSFTTAYATSQRSRSDSVSTGTTSGSSSSSGSGSGSFDPLHSHPTHLAPPRLHNRPIIHSERDSHEAVSTFLEDESSDEEDEDYETAVESCNGYEVSVREAMDNQVEESLQDDIYYSNHERHASQESYFTLDLTSRPPLPQSRWSASTIQTLEPLSRTTSFADLAGIRTPDVYDYNNPDGILAYEEVEPVPALPTTTAMKLAPLPNFSYKRLAPPSTTTTTTISAVAAGPTSTPQMSASTLTPFAPTPRRPQLKSTGDSLDNFLTRGCWKRKGIVFHTEAVEQEEPQLFHVQL